MFRNHVFVGALAFLSTVLSSGMPTPSVAAPAAPAVQNSNVIAGPPSIKVGPVARVVSQVNNSQRSTIKGQTPPILAQASDLGQLSSATPMNHLLMVLQATPQQDHALKGLIDQQLDRGHPNFHRWLTPDEFGAQLGVADADIAQVTSWLSAQGFDVEQVAPGKRLIEFSGTVGQVEAAFQTEMHQYNVNGQAHVSNSSDISVPTALRPVIAGIPTLHNFFKTSSVKSIKQVALPATALPGKLPQFDPASSPFSAPDYTNGTTHFVGAGDFASIYNTKPLLAGGFDGSGISIGIIARTDIHLSDVQVYREFFNLKDNDPTFVIAGEDPGIVPGDDGESYLDVEVSGGAAPGASVKFITSRATLTTDGVDLSAMYAVQNNLTDIISESYGQCEANFLATQAEFYNDLWGQAAAQGQSVFVSSGDNGPASCDGSTSNFETHGYAVSMLASSPYNVAVGGTLFADTTGGPWWGTTATGSPPFASALGYIPEIPWNEAKGSGAVGASGLWSGSGGISAYFQTPAWQRGFGVPLMDPAYPNVTTSDPASPFVAGPHRYMPDVSLAAAAQHDGTLYCGEGICQLSSTNSIVNAGIVGGTSVAAPSMAGIQALIDNFNGGRQGLPNYVYYAIADAQHTAGLNCSAESVDPTCAFHDIDTGSTLICGDSGCTAPKKIGWTAAAGYDLASGLGSPNVANLAVQWASVTFRSTDTTLDLSQTSGITHGQSINASGSVAPGSGSGTPTGQVTFIASSGALTDPVDPNTGGFLNPVSLATLDGSGNYSISLANLPAGTYFLTARYGGDETFASSISAPVQVTVTQESSSVTISPNAFNGTTCAETPSTTFTYGSYIWTDLLVSGTSGQGVPTGTVAVTDNGNALTTATLNASGLAHTLSGAIPTSSCVSGYTFQDTPPLVAGTHVLGATYSGDASFGSLVAAPVTVTINQATLNGTLATASAFIASGDPVQLTFTAAGLSGAGPGTLNPTGTVTFTDNTTATVLGTATLSPNATFGGFGVLPTNGITAAGAHSIVASWPGDNNYAPVTSAAVTVTVQAGTATSVAVTSNANPTTVGGRPTFTATMTPTTVTSGTVNFYDGVVLLGAGTVGAAHTATFRPAAAVSLPAGTHNITAIYAGNATFNSSTSPVFAEVFNKTATTIQLTVKTNGNYGEVFSLDAALGLAGTVTPPASGTITFFDGANPISPNAGFTIVTAASGGFGIFEATEGVVLSPGVHTITATLTDPNYTASTSNAQTITVTPPAPPTLAKAFGSPTVALNGSTALTFTVQNTSSIAPLTGIGFTDPLPAGLVVSTPNGVTGSCLTAAGSVSAAGVATATSGASSISLSSLGLGASETCTFSVNVTGIALGEQDNTTGNISANESGAGGTASASVIVLGPPALSKQFGAAGIPLGGSTSLQFTVQNNNAANTLSGIGFSDTLPAGLVVSTPAGLSSGAGDCQTAAGSVSNAGTVSATAGASSISLSGLALGATGSCTFSVNVTGIAVGEQDNTTGNITSNEGGTGGTASASVIVVGAPGLSKQFATPTVALNGSTALQFTVQNANAASTLSGIGFTDMLPPGLMISSPSGLSSGAGDCQTAAAVLSAGTVTAPPGTNMIGLSGLSLGANSSCTFSVNVTGIAVGEQDNLTGNISSNEGGTGGTAAASVIVVAPPSIAKAFSPAALVPVGTSTLTFTLTNPAPNTIAETGVAFTDPLPTGMTVPDSSTSVCGGTLTATSNVIALTGARIEPNSQCQFSTSVTVTTAGVFTNITGTVSSANGGTGNFAQAILNAGSSGLTVTVDDSHNFARYGQVLNYLVKISNAGPTDAGDIGISEVFSPDVDTANVQWICIGGGNGGTSCASSGTGPLSASGVVIPAGESLTWLVSATVLDNAPDASVDNTITVTTATDPNAPYNVSDSDVLVLFRDGFDVANADGTQSSPQLGSVQQGPSLSPLVHPFVTGQTQTLTLPGSAGTSPVDILLKARAVDGSGFRVERLNLGKEPYLRLVSINLLGVEQPGNWVPNSFGGHATLQLLANNGTVAVLQAGSAQSTLRLSTLTQEVFQVDAAANVTTGK